MNKNKPDYGEPLQAYKGPDGLWRVRNASGKCIAMYMHPIEAKRFASCVNACSGLTDEELQLIPGLMRCYREEKALAKAEGREP